MFYTITGFLAQIVPACSPSGISTSVRACDIGDLQQTVINLINFMLTDVAIPIAVLFVLWGGFLLMTAGGSPDQITKGRKAITAAVVGILIVLISFLAINTFLDWFTNCTGAWWRLEKITC